MTIFRLLSRLNGWSLASLTPIALTLSKILTPVIGAGASWSVSGFLPDRSAATIGSWPLFQKNTFAWFARTSLADCRDALRHRDRSHAWPFDFCGLMFGFHTLY